MIHSLERWEGVSVCGEFTLGQCVGGDEGAAFFQTSLAPDGRRAIVKLVPEAAAGSAASFEIWQRTRQLRHPNLVELIDCGRADHERQIVLYAVFEAHDETLAAALSRSPLTSEESREVLDSVLDALRYLHAQGLVHGAIDAHHIVASGDRIKLLTDSLHDADTSSACRKDVRLLGELWQQALCAASPKSAEIAAHAADPNPQTRWTLAEIGAVLEPPPPVVLPPEPALPLPPVIVPEVVPAPPQPAVRRVPNRAAVYRPPKWIFAGAAAVLLLILGLNRTGADRPAPEPRVAPVSLPAETPPPTPLPRAAAPEPAAGPASAPVPSRPAGKETWRVIAFTYRTRDAAAKRVQQLNQRHPGLHAAIFSPAEQKSYYLVSLGGRMTRDDALRLARNARGKGLPRDLFVQNYSN